MLYPEHGMKISLLKLLISLTIIIGTILYTVDISMINLPNYIGLKFTRNNWNWEIERKQQEHEWDSSYFVNTIGCKMPSFPVYGDHIDKFQHKFKSPVECSIPMTRSNNNFLWISLNETELDIYYDVKDVNDIKCSYTPMYRQTDDTSFLDKTKTRGFGFGETVRINYEFVRVICKNSVTDAIIYKDHHFFVPVPSTNAAKDSKYKPNVMVLGIDSMSRLNFHRQMNKSVSVMLNDLRAIEFFGYNKLEDNTYPNLVPVLTGLDKDEIIDACVPYDNTTFDRCHFIWDKFKTQNYSTLFAEDTGWLGLFNYFRGGFSRQPTDFYLRPIVMEMERSKESKRVVNTYYCLGYRNSFDLFVEYITKFIQSIGSKAYFSFFWSSSYSHDDLLSPQLIDDSFSEFLSSLPAQTIDNTFLFIMSDHGLRFGSFRNTYQGMMEERQPALFIVPPKSFPLRFPNAVKNLLKNRRQLTTHFDLYETLRDLSNLDVITNESIQKRSHELLETDPMPRGISLFLPIPASRSCSLAEISPHWCTCHEVQELSTTDSRVLKSARLIVQHLNKIVKRFPQCQPLSLNSISNANVFSSSSDIKGFEKDENKFEDISVRLQTKPGFAEFEATVRVFNHGSANITGTISRVNLYGKQSQCVDDYEVKLYCYCNSFM
ncbi:uncharacterized protein LOC119066315 [Bradysia coprophila]|uniref:uncharacterized protein LOC119066315 n=1 Tax=Bradysia coprophila TaxID=38358 RepID=UPI00187DB809|nr:uncharacterized protein LOC119066315 [Bradysia coprophila]